MSRTLRLALIGLGNVGRSFLDLMTRKAACLADSFDLALTLTGVADSTGAVLSEKGLNPAAIRAHKTAGKGIGTFPGGQSGCSALAMVEAVHADLLLEASPVNLRTGQPGLQCVMTALRRGMSTVLANKGPLVHAYDELHAVANAAGVQLRYSATVCGALPVVNIGLRDLALCEIQSVRGIFNSTSNSILDAMCCGGSYDEALHQAQLDGVAEADPSLDVEGWDTANKLVIIANSILKQPARLSDVMPVTGITGLTSAQIIERRQQGQIVKLVATARRTAQGRYSLGVEPEWLPAVDFLAQVNGWEMGIVFETDTMGLQCYKVDERGPVPTAAAMLRDVINLARSG